MKQKNEEALRFEEIYQTTFPSVSRYVFFRMDNVEDARDILQNVYADYFINVVRKKKNIENPEAYLIRMSENQCAAFYRTNKRVVTQDDIEPIEDKVIANEDTALSAINQATTQQIWASISKLPLLDQRILVARFHYDLTFSEIATQFDMQEEKIKARYYRSIKKIRELLNL